MEGNAETTRVVRNPVFNSYMIHKGRASLRGEPGINMITHNMRILTGTCCPKAALSFGAAAAAAAAAIEGGELLDGESCIRSSWRIN
jgi:hypothetical protein